MSNNTKQEGLELSAISKTLYFFDSIIAKISIPINLSKLNDTSEWYYLKNNKNENIIGVLISMYFDSKEKNNLPLYNNQDSSFIGGKNMQNKNDISCDILKTNNSNTNNLFLNIINRTNNVSSIINNSVDNIKVNAQSQFIENNKKRNENSNNYNKHINLKLDTTMIYNDNLRSPDTSLTNNLFSPFSCRFENDKINLNLTNINSRTNNNVSANNNKNNYINFASGNINKKTNVNLNSNPNLNNYFSNINNYPKEKSNFNNLLEISNNKTTSQFNNGEPDEKFFEFIEGKLEKKLSYIKDHNFMNMDNSTINRSYNNNYNNKDNNTDIINKEELIDILNKLKYKNNLLKEESEKIRKANEDIKKQKESTYKNNNCLKIYFL